MKMKKGLLLTTSIIVFAALILGLGMLNGQAQEVSTSTDEGEVISVEQESQLLVCTPDTPDPTKMRAYWKLDDGPATTSFTDSVPNTVFNDGACVGVKCPTSNPSGKVGSAFDFDGGDEVVVGNTTGLEFTISGDMSVEAWVKTTQVCTNRVVFIGRYEGNPFAAWWLGCDENNHAAFHMRDSNNIAMTVSGTTLINDGEWHHIVGTRDGTGNSNKVYVDGALEGSGTPAFTGALTFTAKPVTIGYYSVDPFYWFNGTLDEVALYDQALPVGEVARHYLDGSGQSYCNDDLPIPGGVTFQTGVDIPFQFTEAQLTVNDVAPDGGLNLVSITSPSLHGGTISGSGPYIYTPPAGFMGSDTFSYVIEDIDHDQASGEATVLVGNLQMIYLPVLFKD